MLVFKEYCEYVKHKSFAQAKQTNIQYDYIRHVGNKKAPSLRKFNNLLWMSLLKIRTTCSSLPGYQIIKWLLWKKRQQKSRHFENMFLLFICHELLWPGMQRRKGILKDLKQLLR